MSEEGQQKTESGQDESLSIATVLRAAREARGLTVEAIARSLRLNPRYIEALEAGAYDKFPAQPYIRVYLRSVARHLGVDPEQALASYLRQTGQDGGGGERTDGQAAQSAARAERPVISWPAGLVLLLVLVVMGIVATRTNRKAPAPAPDRVTAQPVVTAAPAPADSMMDSAAAPGDSGPTVTDTAATKEAQTAAPAPADSLVLTIAAQKDPVWVQVFADGKSWKDVIKSGRARTFRAADSLNVHVGYNAILSYTLNGTPLQPSDNKGVAVFRVTRKGVKEWSLAQWKTAFEGRL